MLLGLCFTGGVNAHWYQAHGDTEGNFSVCKAHTCSTCGSLVASSSNSARPWFGPAELPPSLIHTADEDDAHEALLPRL
jgi:hypothetical protein